MIVWLVRRARGSRKPGRFGELLPVVMTAESVASGKPAPDAYLEAARLIGQAPARCLAVDDAPGGITSALRPV